MLKMHEEITKQGGFAIEIKPQKKNEDGEWVKNQDYKLKLLGAKMRTITPNNGGEPFDVAVYSCDIIKENGITQRGTYEIPKTNKAGELNYQIKKMIEIDIEIGDIFTLKTDEKGFINIEIVQKENGETPTTAINEEEELPTIDEDEAVDFKDIPF